jgi:hypothetical protein
MISVPGYITVPSSSSILVLVSRRDYQGHVNILMKSLRERERIVSPRNNINDRLEERLTPSL